MTLRWKNVSVPFVGGLQEDVEPLLQTEGFSRLHWFAPNKDGSVSLEDPIKTLGYSIVDRIPLLNVTEGSSTGDTKVVRRGQAYGYVRNGYLYAEAGGQLLRQGRTSPWVVEQSCITAARPNANATFGLIRHDSCISGSYLYTVYETTGFGQLLVAVTDAATGTLVITHVVAENTTDGDWHYLPRIVPYSTASSSAALYFLHVDVSATDVLLKRAVVTATSVGSTSNIDTDLSNNNTKNYNFITYDVWGDGSQNEFVAYNNLTSSGNMTVKTLVNGSATLTETINRTREYIQAIAVSTSASASRIPLAWVEVDDGASGNHEVYSAIRGSGTDIAATLVVGWFGVTSLSFGFFGIHSFAASRLGMCGAGTNREFICVSFPNNGLAGANYGGSNGDAQPLVRSYFISTSGGSISNQSLTSAFRVQLCSRPWWDGTRACYMASYASGSSVLYGGAGLDSTEDNRNQAFYVMGSEPGGSISTSNPDPAIPLAHFGLDYAEPHHTVENPSEPLYSLGHTMRSSPCIESDGTVNLVGLERDIGQGMFRLMRYRLVKDDRVGQFAQLGGATYLCGGLLTQWDGSTVREAGFLAEPCIQRWSTPGGGSMAAGAYDLAVTYARMNAAGELIRSRPSVIKTITCAANDQISISVSPPAPGMLPSVATPSGDRTETPIRVEFWLTEPDTAGPFWLVAVQEVGLQNASVVQTLNSTLIPLIYAISLPYTGVEGEELANDPPVSPVAIAEWRNRLWLSDGYRIQYSKPYDRFRQAEFSSLQVLPKAAGPNVQALVPLGQGLATISDRTGGVAMIYGDGPDITGEGSTLQGPTVMQQSLGTTYPGAIGRIGSAAFVMTQTGLRLLTEGGSVERVGDPAEDSIAASAVRAVHVDGDDTITVLHGGAAERLNLPQKTWSTLTIAASSWEGDRLGGLQGSDLAYSFDTSSAQSFPDDPQVITPWFRPAGEIGEFRVSRIWVLGSSERSIVSTSTALTVSIAYDNSSTYHSAATLTFTQLAAGPWEFRFTPARQRCQSFRLRFTFARSSGTTSNPSLIAMRFRLAKTTVAGVLMGGTNSKGMV